MNLLKWAGRSDWPTISVDDYIQQLNYMGQSYGFVPNQTLRGDREEIEASFEGYVRAAYKSNGVVFACMLARFLLFSEARFQFRRMNGGRPGDLWGSGELALLEKPWTNGTTGDLLTRMLQDADIAGNFYGVRRPGPKGPTVKRLRPDWTTIILGSYDEPSEDIVPGDLDAEVIGYMYQPGGPSSSATPEVLLPEQVAHFAPIPDPLANYRGMSWLTPVLREIMADGAATMHKLKFFENGATPNLVVSMDPTIQKEAFDKWIETFEAGHEGVLNAYKTLYLGGGAKVDVVGSNLQQLDFKITQGGGETRVAAAAGVPPVIVGLSEGLQAATYSNYSQARRRFADGTMRPLWRNAAGSLASIVNVPSDSELWYDDRDISFLKEDLKDFGEIQQYKAVAIKTLIDAGYEPDSVVIAIDTGDLSRLTHTGLVSVQLQVPGSTTVPPPSGRNGDRAAAELAAAETTD